MTHLCGAPTSSGGYCRNSAERCQRHRRDGDLAVPASEPLVDELSPAAGRDLHRVAWWLLEGLVSDGLDPRRASAITAALRFALALGQAPADEEVMLRRAEIHGLLIHGVAPRDEAQWELARAMLDPEALAMVEGWAEAERTGARWMPPLRPLEVESPRLGEP